jgi:hypothetical protein
LAKHSCLGIHYGANGAVAVLVKKQGSSFSAVSTFKVVPEATAAKTSPSELLETLAQQIHQKHSRISSVSLALGPRWYQTLFCHTHFTEPRQLKQTLRYDIEEDIASDSEDQALCYQKLPITGPGSDLMVYTLDRDKIQEVLPCFEQVNLDALRAEPDISAWGHYLSHEKDIPADEPIVFVAWAFSSLYILIWDQQRRSILTRSLVCASASQAHEVLLTELRRSLAPLPDAQQPRHLFYHAGSFTQDQIQQMETRLPMPCRPLPESDAVLAFAAGAAIGWLDKEDVPDFRSDKIPSKTYLSARNKALYGLGAAVVFLLLSLSFVLYAYSSSYQKSLNEADSQMNEAYTSVMGKPPGKSATISREIKREYNKLRNRSNRAQSDQVMTDSASHTFMLIMQALAGLGEKFDLKINMLRLSPKDARLQGTIPNLVEFGKLETAMERQPSLNISKSSFEETVTVENSTRREFSLTINKQAGAKSMVSKGE